VIPTPNGIFRFLESRGRTALRQIPFEDAVRRFLTPIEVTITRDQLELNGLRYLSDELIDSGLLDYAKQNGVIKKKAYMLELCVNTLWLEDSFGKMIEVRSRPPLLEDVEFMPQTFADVMIYKERKAEAMALHAKVLQGGKLGYSNRVAAMNKTAELRHPPIRVKTGAVSVAATRDALATTGGRKAS
jgi:hypothetical protein